MLQKLRFILLYLGFWISGYSAFGQTPTFTVDLSGSADTTVIITDISRNGNVCGSSGGERCIVFNIILNAGSDILNFDVKNPGPPGGAFYQVDCGTPTSLNTPVCITGKKTVSISFCKSGNDQPNYIITAARTVKASGDITLRQGCSGTMSVTGLQTSGIVWTSIFPGVQGAYNSYLSPASGAATTTVTPMSGAPAYIDYLVTGNQTTTCIGTRSDTVRVYTFAPLAIAISPTNPVICSGVGVVVTATPSGGSPAYSYLWNTGATTSSITVSTPGTYTVTVMDQITGCPAAVQTVTVAAAATPAAPTAAGTTVCSGSTANLIATAPGGSYRWYDSASGGSLVFTGASFTTPALTTTTTYYVETFLDCVSPRTPVTVSVTPIPAAPTVSGTAICSGSTASLTATGPGGTYQWFDAASGGTLLNTGVNFTTPVLTSTTTYYVQTIVSACAGPRTAVTVTVTPSPAAPTAAGTTICSGTMATLSATAPGGSYKWYDAPSGGTLLGSAATYTTPVLSTNATYYVQTTVNGCLSPRTTVTVLVNAPPAAPTVAGTTICSGSTATLTATAPGGTYRWFEVPAGGTILATGASFTTPALTANTTYYIETLLGCLSSRTPVTVSVTSPPAAPTASGSIICSGSATTLTATGPGGTYEWYDVNSGGSLLATGASFSSPVLTSNTTYYVQTTINGCTGPRTPVTVTVTPLPPAPTAPDVSTCAGNSATLTATAPGGVYQWYNAASGGNLLHTGATFTTPVLNSSTTYYVQTIVNGCPGSRTAVTVTVIPIINPEFKYSSGTYCKSGPAVTPAPTIYTSGGGTFSATAGLVFANPATGEIDVAATPLGTYTITFTNSSQCPRSTSVLITITNAPDATFSYSSNLFCVGNSNATAIFPSGSSAGLFSSSAGLVFISTSTGEINLSASTPGTYLITNSIAAGGGCAAATHSFSITINPSPPAPTVSGTSICLGSSATLTANVPGGGTYQWYNAPTGGTLVSSGSTFVTSPGSTTTYYVQATENGCAGPRSAVTVTVNSIPPAPTAAGTTVCSGNNATLTATAPGEVYQWYDAPTGGSLLATTASYTTPNLSSSTTYYVQASIGGCTGPRTPVTVTVTPLPPAPTAPDVSTCAGNSATLTATAPGGVYQWYNAASGGNLLHTGATFTTPVLNSSTTYYVQTTVNGCPGSRTAVTVTVIPIINPEFKYSSGTYCKSGPAVTPAPTIYTSGGGTFSATAGLVFANPATGEIDVAATPLGTYTITFTNSSQCPRSTSVLITITNAPDATFSYSSNLFCVGNSNATGIFPSGSSAGLFSSSAGLVFISTSTGEINLSASTPGTYLITNSIAAGGGCAAATHSFSITINPSPPEPTVSGTSICLGSSATLTANVPGGGTYQWYNAPTGGTLVGSGSTFITSPGSTTTYYVQATENGCAGPRSAVTVTVNPIPPAPTAAGTTVCSGNNATLTATAPGEVYQWYDAPTGGSLLATAASYTTPNLTSSTTYYVQATTGGCTGPRTAVTANVTPIPPAPIVSGTTICSGNTALLTATSPGGSYSWYDAPSGGNLLGTGNSFTTPALTSNTTFYVETLLGCVSVRTPAIVNVIQLPPAPAAAGTTVCAGSSTILTATSSGGIYQWFDTSTGGNLLFTGPSFTTPVLTADTSYYVETSVNGCAGPRTTVRVTVNPRPPAPTVSGTVICTGNSATLTATGPGGFYQWFDASSGGNLLHSGNTYITPILQVNTTVYVQTTINACTSVRSAVTITVTPLINPVFKYTSGTYCKFGPAVTPAPEFSTTGGGTFSATTGLVFANVNTGEIDVTATPLGTYTIKFTNNSPCPRSSTVNITITNAPDAAFGYSNSLFCISNTTTHPIFPAGASAGIFGASPEGLVFINNSTGEINLGASSPGTYIVSNNIAATGGCAAVTHNVSVTISSSPPTPAVAGSAICAGNSTTLTASNPGGLYEWFDAAIGGTRLSASLFFTTPILNSSKTYYVQTTINGCTSQRLPVTVSVTPVIEPEFQYSSGTYCKSGIAVTPPPAIYSIGGGTFSSKPGLVFTNKNTGEIDVLASTIGTYIVTFTNNSPCPRITTAKITITNAPDATFSYKDTLCQGAVNPLPNFGSGASAGFFSASAPALVFVSTSTGEIDLKTSSPGTYMITNTIAANGGCSVATHTSSVTITAVPPIPTANDVAICAGNNATLSIPGAEGSYQWFDAATGGKILATGNTLVTSLLFATRHYYVQAINGECASTRKEVLVTVNPIPAMPVVSTNSPVCNGDNIVLRAANITGAQYLWSGPDNFSSTLQNPIINSAAVRHAGTYSVIVTVNGCVSPAATVEINVNEMPSANAGPDQTLCASANAVILNGSVAGLTTTGIWTSTGTGTFSPSNTSLKATYQPSIADKTNTQVVLTLTSTNNQSCAPAVSTMNVNLVPLPVVNAGVDQAVCADAPGITLKGSVVGAVGGVWSTTGDGLFSEANSLNAIYLPGNIDLESGRVTLTLTSTGNGLCSATKDDLLLSINPLPTVSAGKDTTIFQDDKIILRGKSTNSKVQYVWSPAVNLDDYTSQNPVFLGRSSQTFTLTVINEWGCSVSDEVSITVLEPIKIPNTFTPNGDGTNDVWNIAKLVDYPDAVVNIYNRYGVKLFYSQGYKQPWDGTYKGVKVPSGTYYYVIDTKFPGKIYSGYILIID